MINDLGELDRKYANGMELTNSLFGEIGYDKISELFEGLLPYLELQTEIKDVVLSILNSLSIIKENNLNKEKDPTSGKTSKDIQKILENSDNTSEKISTQFLDKILDTLFLLYEDKKEDILSSASQDILSLKEEIEKGLNQKKELSLEISTGLDSFFTSVKDKMKLVSEANRDAFLGNLIRDAIEAFASMYFVNGEKPLISNFRIYIEKGGLEGSRKPSINPFYDFKNPIKKSTQKIDRKEYVVLRDLIQSYLGKEKKGLNLLSRNIDPKTKISYFLLGSTQFTFLKNKHNQEPIGFQREKFYFLVDVNGPLVKGETDLEKTANTKKSTLALRDLIEVVKLYISGFKKEKTEYVDPPKRTTLELALARKDPGALKALEYYNSLEEIIENEELTKEKVLSDFFNKNLLDLTFSIFKQLGELSTIKTYEKLLNSEDLKNAIIFDDVLILRKDTKTGKGTTKKENILTKVYHYQNLGQQEEEKLINSSDEIIEKLKTKLFDENKSAISSLTHKALDILLKNNVINVSFHDFGNVYTSYIGDGYFMLLYKTKNDNKTIVKDSLKAQDTKVFLDSIPYFVSEFLTERGLIGLI